MCIGLISCTGNRRDGEKSQTRKGKAQGSARKDARDSGEASRIPAARIDTRDQRHVGAEAHRRDRRYIQIQRCQGVRGLHRARSHGAPVGKERRRAPAHNQEGEQVPKMHAVSLRNQHTHTLSGFEDREVRHQKEKRRPLPEGRQDSRLRKAGPHHLFDDD